MAKWSANDRTSPLPKIEPDELIIQNVNIKNMIWKKTEWKIRPVLSFLVS